MNTLQDPDSVGALQRSGHAGFTLVELLVAITLLTVVVTIVSSTFISVTTTMELARTGSERLRNRQFLYRIMENNLAAVYADPACLQADYQLLGEDDSGAFGDADRLTFCASLNMPGSRSLPGVFRKVTMEVLPEREADALDASGAERLEVDEAAFEESDEESQGQTLVITLSPLTTTESFLDDSSGRTVASNFDSEDVPEEQIYRRKISVRSVDFKYLRGEEPDDWEDEWDSNQEGRMPWAVKVRVNFARSEEEYQDDIASGINFDEEADFEMVVPLPLGAGVLNPMGELNHYTPSTEENSDGNFDLN